MSTPVPSPLSLTSEQIACLASPLRAEIMNALLTLKTASANTLTEYVAAPPKTLYYHLRQMQEAGLVKNVGTRKVGRREEAIYAPIAENLRIRLDTGVAEEQSSQMARLVSATLRLIDREHRQMLAASANAPLSQPTRVQRAVLHLSPDKMQEFMELLEQVSRFAQENNTPGQGSAFSYSFFVLPLVAP